MLHDALRALTEEAARLLEGRLSDGEEIPFEVGAATRPPVGAGPALFAYKPMTADFVSSHADRLRSLDAFDNAANQLARTRGAIAYLRLRDEPVLDVGELTHARLGVLAFLSAVWSDAERFDQWPPRFESAYSELESVALAERLVTTVFIPVRGVVVDCEVVNLGAGVELLAPEELDGECADRFSDSAEGADCFCAISIDAPSNAPAPMAAVRHQARHALTALRMFKPGSVSLGLAAQANVGGAWRQVSMPFTGRPREEAWRLLPGEADELRQFMAAVRRVERRTRVAWALKRFEMGLERSVPAEGLTDFIAALRALIEAWDDTGKAALPARISALCARDSERLHVRATVEAAFALERLAVEGNIGRADRKRLAGQPPLEVIAETERYLRALLHDLVCGYLATDLKKLADEILMSDGQPTGPETASHDPVYLEPVPDIGTAESDPAATREFEVVFDDTAEISALDTREHDRFAAKPMPGDVIALRGAVEPPASAPVSEHPRDDEGGDVRLEEPPAGVWTLRPAAEIKPAPELSLDPEPSPDLWPDPDPESSPEPGPDSTMRELAERLVDDFDDALGRAIEAEAPPRIPEPEPDPDSLPLVPDAALGQPPLGFEPRPERARPDSDPTGDESHATGEIDADRPRLAADLFESPPAFDPAPSREQAGATRAARPVAPDSPGAESGFTFDFKVAGPIAAAGPAPANHGRPGDPEPDDAGLTPGIDAGAQFPVREFELPAGAGQAVSVSDETVDAGAQRENFNQIMDENFTPPARDLTERPITPIVRDARPRLLAIDGDSPPPGLPGTVEPRPDPPQQESAAADGAVVPLRSEQGAIRALRSLPRPASEFDGDGRWSDTAAGSENDAPAEDPSERSRTHPVGPATIEFRPLVDPDKDDPDDFAGAC